jgi:uncharacterized protein (TIGR00369 family)
VTDAPEITPELVARVIEGTFPGHLGIELPEVTAERVRGRMVVDERHLSPAGTVHGGVWVAFADSVAGWGTRMNLPAGQDFTTAEMKCNFFAAGRPGDVLTAVGTPLHVGRRTQAWEVRVHNGDRLAAFFACTQMILAPS